MTPGPLFGGACQCFGAPVFVAPASRRLLAFAVALDVAFEFAAPGPAKRDRAAVAVALPWAPFLTLLS